MPEEKIDDRDSIEHLPIGNRAYHALMRSSDIRTITALSMYTPRELRRMKWMGVMCIADIQRALEERGLSLRHDSGHIARQVRAILAQNGNDATH